MTVTQENVRTINSNVGVCVYIRNTSIWKILLSKSNEYIKRNTVFSMLHSFINSVMAMRLVESIEVIFIVLTIDLEIQNKMDLRERERVREKWREWSREWPH